MEIMSVFKKKRAQNKIHTNFGSRGNGSGSIECCFNNDREVKRRQSVLEKETIKKRLLDEKFGAKN